MSDQQYDNRNTGAAFPNKNKTEDWQADLTGTVDVERKEYYVNLTKKVSKQGKNYVKITLKAKDDVAKKGMSHAKGMVQQNNFYQQQNAQPQNVTHHAPQEADFVDDDLPF